MYEKINEHIEAEEKLNLAKHIIDTASDAVFWLGPEGNFLYANDSACKSLGFERDELMKMHIYDVNPRANQSRWGEVVNIFREHKQFQAESIHRRKDGSEFPVELVSTYVKFNDKEYLCGFARDITERKRKEEALKESEERYRSLFENSPDAIFLTDPESGRILDANPKASDLIGKSRDEIKGMHRSQLHPTKQTLIMQKEGTMPIESSVICSDGREIPVEIIEQKVTINGRPVLQGIFRDITQRKLAETKIQKLNAELEQRVRERTTELETANDELYQFNRLFVGRELRIIELKENVAKLEKEIGDLKNMHFLNKQL